MLRLNFRFLLSYAVRGLIIGLTLISFTVATYATDAQQAIVSTIVSSQSNKCLDVVGGSTQDHANVQQYACHNGDNQRWELRVQAAGLYQFVNRKSNKCLDVEGASTQDRANVQQYTCHSGDNQLWYIHPHEQGNYEIVSRKSGKCLDVEGASTQDRANIQQYTCHSGNNQRWLLTGGVPTLPPSTVMGRVLWDERPVAGASVYATDEYDFNSVHFGSSTTDVGGFFIIAGVPAGKQYLYTFGNQPGFWVSEVTPFQMSTTAGTWAQNAYLCKGFEPLSPTNGQIVATAHPILFWPSYPHAVDYAVRVIRKGDSGFIFQRGDNDPRLTTTSVQVDVYLAPGVYNWRVDAFNNRGHIIGCSYFPRGFAVTQCADYAKYTTGAVEFACNNWQPSKPNIALGLFDIVYGLQGPSDPGLGPTQAALAAIQKANGTIVHTYNVPMVRALLPPNAVATLGANHIYGVADACDLSVHDVIVGYKATVTTSDIALIQSLGGTVDQNLGSYLIVTMPDSAIRALRSQPQVEYVELNLIRCSM